MYWLMLSTAEGEFESWATLLPCVVFRAAVLGAGKVKVPFLVLAALWGALRTKP